MITSIEYRSLVILAEGHVVLLSSPFYFFVGLPVVALTFLNDVKWPPV